MPISRIHMHDELLNNKDFLLSKEKVDHYYSLVETKFEQQRDKGYEPIFSAD